MVADDRAARRKQWSELARRLQSGDYQHEHRAELDRATRRLNRSRDERSLLVSLEVKLAKFGMHPWGLNTEL